MVSDLLSNQGSVKAFLNQTHDKINIVRMKNTPSGETPGADDDGIDNTSFLTV